MQQEKQEMTIQQKMASQDQQNKLQQLFGHVDAGKKELVIKGAAGVGKTYVCAQLVEGLVKRFNGRKPTILCTALAHQACGVLERMLGDIDAEFEVKTLASGLHHKKYVDANGVVSFKYKEKKIKSNGKYVVLPPPVAMCDILIADECSQIGEIKDDIDNWVQPDCIRIYLGDICQHPPINSQYLLSPTFEIDGIELTIPFRYEGDLQDLGEVFRTEIKKGIAGQEIDINIWKQFVQLPNKDYVFTSDKNFFFEHMKTHNMGNSDPYHTMFVSYHNFLHEKVSKYIRGQVNPNTFDYEPGDVIMATNTYCPDGMRNILVNSEHGIIERKAKFTAHIIFTEVFGEKYYHSIAREAGTAEEITELYSAALREKVIVEPMEYFSIKLHDKKDWIPIYARNLKRLKEIGQKILDYDHYADKEEFEGNKWLAYYDIFSFFAEIQYGYGCTSHKVQGSTYDVVFIHLSDILSVKGVSDLQKLHAIYVALTRARYKVYIFFDVKDFQK